MSRIGKQPVVIPTGVKVEVANGKVRVEGPKGKLEFTYHRKMQVNHDDKGKGIRYENEQVRRKEGKSFTSGG